MTYAAQVAIAADRYTPCVRTITFRGLDLTGVALRMQVRQNGDTPGAPMVDLQNVANAQAEGLKLVSVDVVDGYPTSIVQIRINETTIKDPAKFPFVGELGDASPFAYDLIGTLGGDKRVLMAGPFTVAAGVTGADNAPVNRPFGYGSRSDASGMRAGAILTFGETRIDVTVDGAALVAPQVEIATDAAAAAQADAQLAEMAAQVALASSRYFDTRAAGEAGSALGQLFATHDGDGVLIYYERNVGGSYEIGRALSPAALAAADAASKIGFVQVGQGGVPETLSAAVGRTKYADQFGVKADGESDDTEALARAINAAEGGTLYIPAGVIVAVEISVPSFTVLRGQGLGKTILKQKGGSSRYFLVNAQSTGDRGIALLDFTIDGNGPEQTNSSSGVVFDKCQNCVIGIEVKNCFGTGIVISGGGWNLLNEQTYSHGNGKTSAGYGAYFYNSDGNIAIGGRYDDNCIGIAVEASGIGAHSNFNRLIHIHAEGNRADHDHSGAGAHFEASSGGNCDFSELAGGVIANGTGIGINNTGCAVKISGTTVKGNSGAAVSTLAASQFQYSGLKLLGNGDGAGEGYRAQMIFDAPGYASDGVVDGCYVRGGAAVDGALRTTQPGSAVKFLNNDVAGYATPYVLSGNGDILVREERGSFVANLTGGAAGIEATVEYRITGDEVVLDFRTGLIGSSGGGVSCGFEGAPNAIYPAVERLVPVTVMDNGTVELGTARIATNAVATLYVGGSGAFSGAGDKGIPAGAQIKYRLR